MLAKRDYYRALSDFTRAMELAPSAVEPYSGRGYAYHLLGDHKCAHADLLRAAALAPNEPRIKNLLATVDSVMRQAEAEAKAKAAQEQASSETELWLACYSPENPEAVSSCTALLDGTLTHMQRLYARRSRGKAFAARGEFERAIVDFTSALALDARDFDSVLGRAAAHLKQGNLERTRADAALALTLRSQDPEAKRLLASAQSPVPAQQTMNEQAALSQPIGKRVALVIGNSAYRHTAALPNPRNDAADTAAALSALGFSVIAENDLTKQGMDKAFVRFAREAQGAEAALFYYAGHAMEFEGVNYLMPVDAELKDEAGLPYEMAKFDDILADMSRIEGVRIAVLDACRNNPLEDQLKRSIARTRSAKVTRGLARIARPEGHLIAFATQPGEVAEDGRERNSPFTAALLKNISVPGLEVGLLFRRVTGEVKRSTAGRQVPALSISLESEFYFKPAP